MNEYRILVVEDDEDINNLLKNFLEPEGYTVMQAFSGTEARFYLRKELDVPILVISGKTSLEDKVRVLELGADDYIIKPFEKLEVLARIKVLMRRVKFQEEKTEEDVIKYKSLVLNPKNFETLHEDKEIPLTQTEFMILYEFVKDPDSVFSRNRLYDLIWGYEYQEGNNAITVHISHLRQKLRQVTGEEIIGTVWGVGYKLNR